MPAGRSRDTALTLIVALAAVVVPLGLVLHTFLPPRQRADVRVPGSDASPQRVVEAYLRALDAHDCATAEALSASGFEPEAKGWCEDVSNLSNIEVDAPAPGGDDIETDVPVSFDLDWRPFHDDGSMPRHVRTWDFWMTRVDGPGRAWRIFDQGTG